MSKKNIGAAISVLAASAAVATAYASTVTNLENEKHTNSLVSEENKDVETSNSFVKSDYTKDVKNTNISGEKRDAKKASEEVKKNVVIEATAKKLAEPKVKKVEASEELSVTEASEESTEDTKAEEVENEVSETSQEVVSYDDEPVDGVVSYDDEDLDENTPVENEEETTEASKEVVEYDDSKLENREVATYQMAEEDTNEAPLSYELDMFVNTPSLNIRSSADLSSDSNIVRTIKAGDKLTGRIEGDFLVTNEGYVAINYLSETYPEALVEEIKAEEARLAEEARKAEEVKKAEEARIAEEARKAEEAKVAEEARLAEEARIAEQAKAEEEARLAEERKAEEAKAQERSVQQEKAAPVYHSGWVKANSLNVRDRAENGNIISSLTRGDWVEGNLANGWLEVNLNGNVGYIDANYLSDTEIVKEEVVKEVVAETVVEEETVAPVNNQNSMSAAGVASQFVGMPYVWGSSNPSVGFDCSGLTSYAYRQVGVNLPHNSAAQYGCGYQVNLNNLQAGDLVFFSFSGAGIDHVGIMTGSDGSFIHASTPQTGVRYDNIFNQAYQNSYVGARRIF